MTVGEPMADAEYVGGPRDGEIVRDEGRRSWNQRGRLDVLQPTPPICGDTHGYYNTGKANAAGRIIWRWMRLPVTR